MRKLSWVKLLLKFKPPEYLRIQVGRLLLTLTLFLLIPSVVNLRLGNAQPAISDESVLELPIISPPAPPAKTKDVVLDTQQPNPTVKVGSKNLSGLCSGVTESWKHHCKDR